MLPFAYDVRISDRARRCRIQVGPAGVTLVVPRRMPVPRAETFLHANKDWVHSRLDALRRTTPTLPEGTVLFRGEPLPPSVPAPRMASWLRRQARNILPSEVKAQAERTGLHPKRIFLRDQRTRWGSCSMRGNISLNWRLVMAPPDVLSYVVVHELCHLVEHNHGPRFWALVQTYCPDFRIHKAWLKKHGTLLHQPM